MFKHVVFTTALLVVVLFGTPAISNAQNITDVLARMDAIIKEMESLRAEFSALSTSLSGGQIAAPTPQVQGAASCDAFTEDLSNGATNDDIAKIQRLLATDPEIYPYGVDSGFFGPKTEAAIKNFQARFGLDTVGVIGPATTKLLEVFICAYPDENYPAGVLSRTPQVQGASTANPPATNPTPSAPVIGAARSVKAEMDRGEADVDIVYSNGNRRSLLVSGDSESEVINAIAARTPLTRSDIEAVIEFDENSSLHSRNSEAGANDAEDAIDEADEVIKDTEDKIDEADGDGEDIDWSRATFKEAEDLLGEAEDAYDDEDYDKAVEKAEEAKDLAKEAEDRIGEEERDQKGDSDEIDSVTAEVDKNESEITVEYDSDDDYVFTVEEDKKDEIIDAVADELDLRSSEVGDLIEFDFGDIDSIDALVDEAEDETRVTIEFESGVKMRFTVNSADEDDVIDEVADEVDERSRKIEGIINFDY